MTSQNRTQSSEMVIYTAYLEGRQYRHKDRSKRCGPGFFNKWRRQKLVFHKWKRKKNQYGKSYFQFKTIRVWIRIPHEFMLFCFHLSVSQVPTVEEI